MPALLLLAGLFLLAAGIPALVVAVLARRLLQALRGPGPTLAAPLDETTVQRLHDFQRRVGTATTLYLFATSFAGVTIGHRLLETALQPVPAGLRGLASALLFLVLIAALYTGLTLARHRLVQELRGVETNRWEEVRLTLVFVLLALVPLAVWFIVWTVVSNRYPALANSPVVMLVLVLAFFALSSAFLPAVLPRLFRARPCTDPARIARIEALLERAGLRLAGVFVLPWSRHRIGNAFFTGLRRPAVYLSDDLLEHFSPEELDGVVAHELGHVRLYHLWLRSGVALLWIPVWLGFSQLMDWLHVPATPPVFLATLAVLLFLYNGLGVTWLSRRLEVAADRYVLSLGIDVAAYISALEKLSRLNTLPRRWRGGESLLRTHPSIEQRVALLRSAAEATSASMAGQGVRTALPSGDEANEPPAKA